MATMTGEQKRAAGLIGLLLLLLAVAAMMWLAWLAGTDDVLVDPDADRPMLNFSWKAVAFFMRTGPAINTIFGVLLIVIAGAVAVIGENYTRIWSILAVSLLCLGGIGAATCTLIFMSEGHAFDDLVFAGEFQPSAAHVQFTGVLAPVIGWFSTLLAAELGLSAVTPDGAVRKVVEQVKLKLGASA
jgi:hypothetical protein